jgi:hypothetical protein
MARRNLAVLVVVLASATASPAIAETRGALRAGVMVLELESSRETPLFGEQVGRAVDRYNAAAAAYEQAGGGTMSRIDEGDLALRETLLVLAPGLEVGGRRYFFRIEAPIGLGADLRSIGLGVYPLNLQARAHRKVALYLSAGGTASLLDRPGDGDRGGLVAGRAAVGARIAGRVVVELGYSAFAIGGSVNDERLETRMFLDEDQQPVQPDDVIAAGEARGLVDVSVGVTF